MRCLGQGAPASGDVGAHNLGDLRGGAVEPRTVSRPVRRLQCRAGRSPSGSNRWRLDGSLSKTCLVRFDSNKYSVEASAVGRPVEIRAYAERLEIRQDGRIVGEHRRAFGRGKTVYDPWHYVPVLARKPGALRNGAPFKGWELPAPLERVRRKLKSVPDGDRQMVEILSAALTDGLPAVEVACSEALADGVHSSDVILNILARRREPAPPAPIATPEALRLVHEPVADCARYDTPRRAAR